MRTVQRDGIIVKSIVIVNLKVIVKSIVIVHRRVTVRSVLRVRCIVTVTVTNDSNDCNVYIN